LSAPAIVGALVADVSVQNVITSLVPFAVLSQGYCPLGTLSDGVCIGLGSFGHLPGIMIGSFVATCAALSLVAKYKLGVVGVWGCMNVFLSARVLGHVFASTNLRESLREAFGKHKSSLQAV
jgi:Na+-driven multidrug efflux pump